MRSKQCFLLVLVLSLIACFVIIHSSQPRHDSFSESFHRNSQNKLKETFGLITNFLGNEKTNCSITNIVRGIAEDIEESYDGFKVRFGRNSFWLAINPRPEGWWEGQQKESADLAVYVTTENPKTYGLLVDGITFSGQLVRLTNRPSWAPLKVEEMARAYEQGKNIGDR